MEGVGAARRCARLIYNTKVKGRHFDREIIILGCVGISGSNSVFGISWK
jgi:hypothetical protein